MSDNRTAEHKTLEDCKNEIARKHHWEKWSDLLYTGMDEEILLLYHAEATEMFYSQQTASLREENEKLQTDLMNANSEIDQWKDSLPHKALVRRNRELQEEVERLTSALIGIRDECFRYRHGEDNGDSIPYITMKVDKALSSKESKPS